MHTYVCIKSYLYTNVTHFNNASNWSALKGKYKVLVDASSTVQLALSKAEQVAGG